MIKSNAKMIAQALNCCGIHATVEQSAVVDFCVAIPNGNGEVRIASDGVEQYDDRAIDSSPSNKIRFHFNL